MALDFACCRPLRAQQDKAHPVSLTLSWSAAAGSRDAVRSMIKAAEVEAEAASLTKAAVLAAAAAHRNLPPHHAEATVPEDAYRCAAGIITVSRCAGSCSEVATRHANYCSPHQSSSEMSQAPGMFMRQHGLGGACQQSQTACPMMLAAPCSWHIGLC